MKTKLLLFASMLFLWGISAHARQATQVNVIGSTGTVTIPNNTATVVDPQLIINANGSLTDFTVSISGTYTSGDELSYTGALPAGVTTTGFNTTTGVIMFTGTLSATDWQVFLRKVTLRTTSATCFPERRKVSFTVGNKYYNPLTGNFYEYHTTNRTWSDAKANADSKSYFGRQGYLVTITSAAENNFIYKIMSVDCWLGGTDNFNFINAAVGTTLYANQAASEGRYYWICGPEKGTQFSNQNAYQSGGVQSVSSRYHNWYTAEPNDYPGQNNTSPGEEDYVHMYSTSQPGTWNDLPNSSSLRSIIEFGGMPNDNTSSNVVSTREVYINGAPSGTINGGGGTVCSGTNTTTLTLAGLTGTVVRWESSLDNFLTAGTTISNTTSTLVVSNLTKTTYYRAVVNSTSPATCSNLVTSAVTVNVATTEAGNVYADNSTICPGATALLTLFGNSGSILKWQVANNSSFTSPTDIANTTINLSYVLGSAGTYYFRAQVQNGGCGTPVWTSGKAITVTAGTPPVGGNVTSTEHCAGSNSGSLTLSGHTGTISKWQYSIDNGVIWTDVSNTTATLNYTGVTATRLYRAVLSNGSCGTVNSNAGTVTVFGSSVFKWLGTLSNDGFNTSNWLCGNKPVAGADVIINASAPNDLVLDQSYAWGSVNFSGSNRKIVLGNYNLSVASFTGANSTNYVQTNGTGKLTISINTAIATLLPVGNSAYNPLTITNRTGTTDNFSVQVLDEVYRNGSNGALVQDPRVKRTWDISKSSANGGSGIDLVFNWNSGETYNLTAPRLFHYTGGKWVKETGTTSSTATSLTYTGYTGTFSPFAIGDNLVTLPVTWLQFTAKLNNDKTTLNWSTANEQNSQLFEVNHSSDGVNWQPVGYVNAAGNSNTMSSYSFVHNTPVQGNNYYRILQKDVDGRSSYSSIATVLYNSEDIQFSVYPNPVVNGSVTIQLNKAATVSLYNATGNLVLRKKLTAGTQVLDLSQLAKGVYHVQANTSTATIMVK